MIGWKRRSSAASFSMCFWYSSERGGADGAQFAAGQGRLEQIAGVHRSFSLAGADNRVQLVDEQNHLPVALRDFFDHRFKPVFKFAAEFRPRDQRADVERNDASCS